jgi:hypothetical protein
MLTQDPQLFDQQASAGKVSSSSSKESVVAKAGEMAMKMYFKNQVAGGGGSGGDGYSSAAGFLKLASKLM